MTEEYIRKLDDPKAGDFDDRTWAAIAYAREFAINRGDVRSPETIAAFDKHYKPEERETITALISIMDFANRFNNMWFKPLDRRSVFGAR